MKRCGELIHFAAGEAEKYLGKYLNPTDQIKEILWECGIRKQYYYTFGRDILRTYEYTGRHFGKDMETILAFPETADFFVKKRRREVPEEELDTATWWAPIKWEGMTLMEDPTPSEEDEISVEFREEYSYIMSGKVIQSDDADYVYDEDDWSESVHM